MAIVTAMPSSLAFEMPASIIIRTPFEVRALVVLMGMLLNFFLFPLQAGCLSCMRCAPLKHLSYMSSSLGRVNAFIRLFP
jgi:hypothetical protein